MNISFGRDLLSQFKAENLAKLQGLSDKGFWLWFDILADIQDPNTPLAQVGIRTEVSCHTIVYRTGQSLDAALQDAEKQFVAI